MRLCCPQPSVAHDGEGRRTDPQYPIDGLLRAEIVRLVRTGRRAVYAALKPEVAAPKFCGMFLATRGREAGDELVGWVNAACMRLVAGGSRGESVCCETRAVCCAVLMERGVCCRQHGRR